MLTRADFLSLNFVKKEDYTGSYKGLRYMLRQEAVEDEKKLRVYIWPEPFGYEATPEERNFQNCLHLRRKGWSRQLRG